MNFWEARQAALEGKKVKMIGSTKSPSYTPDRFLAANFWTKSELNAEWEIVEEPKHQTYYFNAYKSAIGCVFDRTELCDIFNNPADPRLTTIAITIDENGKLISAKNV